jgi:hypothetical protein
MTTVGTTSYYSSANRYIGTDRSSASTASDAYRASLDDEKDAGASKNSGTEGESGPSLSVNRLQGQLNLLSDSDWKKAAINVSELPEDQYQSFMEQDEQRIAANKKYLENQYTQTYNPDYSNDPRMKPYATITIAGQVVATIDNQGVVSTDSNALGDRINKLLIGLNDKDSASSGPAGAEYRADKIAEMLGGRIVKAGTAMTQSQYNTLAPFEQPTSTIDYDAMKNDALYEQLQNMSASYEKIQKQRIEYLAQQ